MRNDICNGSVWLMDAVTRHISGRARKTRKRASGRLAGVRIGVTEAYRPRGILDSSFGSMRLAGF